MRRQIESALRVVKATLDSYTQNVIRDDKAHGRELRIASVVAERRLQNTWWMRRRWITTTPWHLSQLDSKNTKHRRSVRKNMTSTT